MTDDFDPQPHPQPEAAPEPAVVPRWRRRDPAFDWEERIARALTRDPDWEAKRAKAEYDAWVARGGVEEGS